MTIDDPRLPLLGDALREAAAADLARTDETPAAPTRSGEARSRRRTRPGPGSAPAPPSHSSRPPSRSPRRRSPPECSAPSRRSPTPSPPATSPSPAPNRPARPSARGWNIECVLDQPPNGEVPPGSGRFVVKPGDWLGVVEPPSTRPNTSTAAAAHRTPKELAGSVTWVRNPSGKAFSRGRVPSASICPHRLAPERHRPAADVRPVVTPETPRLPGGTFSIGAAARDSGLDDRPRGLVDSPRTPRRPRCFVLEGDEGGNATGAASTQILLAALAKAVPIPSRRSPRERRADTSSLAIHPRRRSEHRRSLHRARQPEGRPGNRRSGVRRHPGGPQCWRARSALRPIAPGPGLHLASGIAEW